MKDFSKHKDQELGDENFITWVQKTDDTEIIKPYDLHDLERDKASLNTYEKQRIIEMRNEWSNIFKILMLFILFFEIFITLCVGFGLMHFADEWFLRIIVLGGFAQILSMPYLVTQFLFNKDSILSRGDN